MGNNKTYENSEKLVSLQDRLFGILKNTISVCNQLNLTYYAMFGTLLGVIRHKDFIPWDDDIDLGMPRPDYERFIKEAPKLLPKNLFLQHWSTEKEYLVDYVKIRDSSTSFFEIPDCLMKTNHGIWIDIFPIDGSPASAKLERRQKKTIHKIRLSEERFMLHGNWDKRTFPKNILVTIYKLLFCGKFLRKDCIDLSRAWDETASAFHLDNSTMARCSDCVFPKRFLGNSVRMASFRDIQIRIPEYSEEFLTHLYGDYMTPPPVNKQISNHIVLYFNLATPYRNVNVQNELLRFGNNVKRYKI